MQALQSAAAQFQREVAESQTELQKLQAEILQPILEKLQKTVTQVATKQGYTFVFEKGQSSLLFGRPEFDVTEAVIKEFDKAN